MWHESSPSLPSMQHPEISQRDMEYLRGVQQAQMVQQKPESLERFVNLKLPNLKWMTVLRIGGMLTSAATLAIVVNMLRQSTRSQEGVLETPVAQQMATQSLAQQQQNIMDQAGRILRQEPFPVTQIGIIEVLGHPVPVTERDVSNGNVLIPLMTYPEVNLSAAQVVIAQQGEYLQQKDAHSKHARMLIGVQNPEHPCYQLPISGPSSCVTLLKSSLHEFVSNPDLALSAEDREMINFYARESFYRIEAGQVSFPGEIQGATLELAYSIRDEAQRIINERSPNGRSQQMNDYLESLGQ